MQPGITLTDVSRTYVKNELCVNALSGVSFIIPADSLWVVAGPSGSGKTTLLNLLGGLDRPTSGTISVGDCRLTDMDERELSLFRRHHVGIVFQGNNLIETLTAYENIELPLLLTGSEAVRERVMKMLDYIGLANRWRAFPSELSGGEQQRIAIARAIVHSPSMVLADEPTANLDSKTSEEIFSLLERSCRLVEATILFATHDPLIIGKTDNVLRLVDGRLQDC